MKKTDVTKVVGEWAKIPRLLGKAISKADESNLEARNRVSRMSLRETAHHLAEANIVAASMILAAAGNNGCTYDWSWLYPDRKWTDRMRYAHLPVKPALDVVKALNRQVRNLVTVNPNVLDHSVTLFDKPGGDTYSMTVSEIMLQEVDHAREHLDDSATS